MLSSGDLPLCGEACYLLYLLILSCLCSAFHFFSLLSKKNLISKPVTIIMGVKGIRTALKVDLDKHAREQPGLHVSGVDPPQRHEVNWSSHSIEPMASRQCVKDKLIQK